jgi:hypothetical protein
MKYADSRTPQLLGEGGKAGRSIGAMLISLWQIFLRSRYSVSPKKLSVIFRYRQNNLKKIDFQFSIQHCKIQQQKKATRYNLFNA